MKANNGKGNNASRDMWETPQWLFNTLDKQYKFKFDCCATKENKKTQFYSNAFEKLRFIDGVRMAWMNPPFSKAYEMFKHFFDVVYGVAIYRCDNFETKIWQQLIFPNTSWIFISNKRIIYESMQGKGSRFPSALIGFNVPKPIGLQGTILKVSSHFNKH